MAMESNSRLCKKPRSDVFRNNFNDSDMLNPELVKKNSAATKIKISNKKKDQILAKGTDTLNTFKKDGGKKESTLGIANDKSSKLSKEKFKIRPKSNKKEPNIDTKSNRTKNKFRFHASVKEILKNNPRVKIPKQYIGLNLSPIVSLNMGEVETYLKMKNLKTFVNEPKDDTSKKETATINEKGLMHSLKKQHSNGDSNDSTNQSNISRKRKRSLTVGESSDQEETTSKDISEKADMCTPGTVELPLMVSNKAKTKPIFLCNLCGSVEYSNFMLKNHMAKKHMVCPFCKKRFRSLKSKDDHITNKCEIKQKLDSCVTNGIAVKQERHNKIVKLRRKHQNGCLQLNPSDYFSFDKIEKMFCGNNNALGKKSETLSRELKHDKKINNNPFLNETTQNEIFGNVVPKAKNFEIHSVSPNNHRNIETEKHLDVFKVSLSMKHEAELGFYTSRAEDAFDYCTELSSKNVPMTKLFKDPLTTNTDNNIIKKTQLPMIRVKSVKEINKMDIF